MENTCKNCNGAFRCSNPESPCYGYYCGEFPGTGKFDTEEEGGRNNGSTERN